jgi:hypothetical protein
MIINREEDTVMSRLYEEMSKRTEPETSTNQTPAPIENAALVPADDGFADAATEENSNLLRGSHLKFVDWHYYKDGSETPLQTEGLHLLAIGTAAAMQRWENGKVVQTIIRQPGKELPDRDDLGFLDRATWEHDGRGEPSDPWANTRFLYLVDPRTAEMITFTTKSYGGRGAVSNLSSQIARMRSLRGANVRPLIELGAAPMPTKFGPKSKPAFIIIRWFDGGDNGASPPKVTNGGGADALKLVAEVKEPALKEEMEDEIPF